MVFTPSGFVQLVDLSSLVRKCGHQAGAERPVIMLLWQSCQKVNIPWSRINMGLEKIEKKLIKKYVIESTVLNFVDSA